MRASIFIVLGLFALTACDNYTPHSKAATYDPVTGKTVMPYPCPDWSQSQTQNYKNEVHSNFGCATNTNTAAQLAYPHDLVEGHGTDGPDTETSTHVIERYRAPDNSFPAALTPMQTGGAGL